MQYRRSEYDVTDRVKLRNPYAVYHEIRSILADICPESMSEPLHQAFSDLTQMYKGDLDGYLACDVPYHDLQHVMDVTLAAARLISGFEQSNRKSKRLGSKRAVLGIILALYHDCGYIRSVQDGQHDNGAEYTRSHISRGADYLTEYLPRIGLADAVPMLTRLIHFTGYEMLIEDIDMSSRKDRILGYLVGSADLLAQMADRCYLEKCRDRLYPEFVLGGMTTMIKDDGTEKVLYDSPEDLLRKTPEFYEFMAKKRMEEKFENVSQYAKTFFGGQDLYHEEIDRNLGHLNWVIKEGDFSLLRRTLPDTPESQAFPYQRVA